MAMLVLGETGAGVWTAVAMLVVGAAGVIAMLFSLASVVRNQTYVHDTTINVHKLKLEYQARLKELEEKAEEVQLIEVKKAA